MTRRHSASFLIGLLLVTGAACSIFYTRPVQEMNDTQSAIRAAREVQADTLAPELFRQSNEWFFRAKHEYKFKNFKLAKEYSNKARYFAEQAEFESIRNGGNRGDAGAPDPAAGGGAYPPPPPPPPSYPNPTGTPIESYPPPSNGSSSSTPGSVPGATPTGGINP